MPRAVFAVGVLAACASTRPAYYDGTQDSIAWKARLHLECETGKLRVEDGGNQVVVYGCDKRARYTLLGPYRKAMLEEVEPWATVKTVEEPPPASPP